MARDGARCLVSLEPEFGPRPLREVRRQHDGVHPDPRRLPTRVLASTRGLHLRVRGGAGGRDARAARPLLLRGALALRCRPEPAVAQLLAHLGGLPRALPRCRRAAAVGPRVPAFALRVLQVKGLYCFSPKDAAGMLFTGLPDKIKRRKEGFFFLKSSAPWPCPVLWGEPTKKSTADPVLTNEEKSAVANLLRVCGAAPIDVLIYLSEGDLAAARMTPRAPKPPTPSRRMRDTGAKGMDPSTYAMMQNMRAEKAAAAKVAVKSEPG